MESDSTTIMGRSRTPASDAGVDEDDYSVLNLDVIARAMKDLKARRASLGEDSGAQTGGDADATALVQTAFLEQSARRVEKAERLFVAALEASRSCGPAWYGLASLLHECQHGGLSSAAGSSEDDGWRERQLAQAADAALIAARYEPTHPRALALLGDVLNDLGNHREACRAWTAAEARGQRHWRSVVAPWAGQGGRELSAFGPREPLHSLKLGDEPVEMQRKNGVRFTVRRVADRPHAFVLQGFSTEQEREAIIKAGESAPMRQVPKATDGDPDDERSGCEVAWLASPVTDPDTPWACLMQDAAQLVLPPDTPSVPDAGPAEDLHVVKYATAGAYGLHLDATCAVPRAVTVLHYLNDVPQSDKGPGFGGETWLPLADGGGAGGKPVPGKDGVLVPPRAGDALVFFSFSDNGEVESAALHGGRPTSAVKWIANQVRSCIASRTAAHSCPIACCRRERPACVAAASADAPCLPTSGCASISTRFLWTLRARWMALSRSVLRCRAGRALGPGLLGDRRAHRSLFFATSLFLFPWLAALYLLRLQRCDLFLRGCPYIIPLALLVFRRVFVLQSKFVFYLIYTTCQHHLYTPPMCCVSHSHAQRHGHRPRCSPATQTKTRISWSGFYGCCCAGEG